MGLGFMIDGQPIKLVPPISCCQATAEKNRLWFTVCGATTRKSCQSLRIWVEGVHDAELVEKFGVTIYELKA